MKTIKIIILSACMIIGLASSLSSQTPEEMRDNLPQELSIINHFGTEFLFSVPPCIGDDNTSGENEVQIFITSITRTFVTITGRYNYYQTRELSPYQTSQINVPAFIAQPYLKSSYEPAMPNIIFTNSAVRITSDEPIAVYAVVKFNKASDAFLAYPVSSLGKKYIVSSYNDASAEYPGFYSLPSMTAVVATYDNTIVTFKLGGNSKTNLGTIGVNDTITRLLNKGDVWLLSSLSSGADLSGSVIESNLPVGVLSGNQCANIPSGNLYCDYIVEMETPVRAWGNTFHVPIIKGRKKSPLLRIYASLPNTDIYLDGNKIMNIATAGGVIGTGYREYRINSVGEASVGVISSNKPIAVSLFNTGVQEDLNPEPLGDPFQMTLVPEEQYQKEILYTTRGVNNDTAKIYESYITIAYKKNSLKQIPDELQLGVFNGKTFIWSRIKDIAPVIHKEFVKNSYDEIWALFTFAFQYAGVIKIRSNEPIAAYYYGLAINEGIGFPLAMGLQEVSSKDKEAPHVSYTMNCLGNVKGIAKDFPEDASVRSNLAYPLFYSDSNSYNYDREFGYIVQSDTREIDWKLTVRDRDKPAQAVVLFRDFAGNDTLIIIKYSPLEIEVIPEMMDFGSIRSGGSITKEFKIRNFSDKQIDLTEIRFNNPNSYYEILDPKPFGIIMPNEEKSLFVRFQGTDFGVFTDSIGFGDGCRFHFKASLQAKVGNPDIVASDVSFYDVNISKPKELQFAVINKGKSDLHITGYSGPFTDNYVFQPDVSMTSLVPLTIAPNEYHTFTLTCDPKSEGALTDSIVFLSDALVSDSISLISARGIKPRLLVESYDWGRKRIFSPSKPFVPYPVNNATNSLKIENIGSGLLEIADIKIKGDAQSLKSFYIEVDELLGKRIYPGQTLTVSPKYLPTALGEHFIEISFIDENNNTTNMVLRGKGVAPYYSSKTIDMGTTVIGDLNNYNVRQLIIKNSLLDEFIFGDTLKIKSLAFSPDNSVAINNGFGKEGFRMILKDIVFPIILPPGESSQILVYFSAAKLGQNKAFVNLNTDAVKESAFVLQGVGVDTELSLVTDLIEVCLNEKSFLPVELKNNGANIIDIGGLKLEKETAFYFQNPQDKAGFEILPQHTKTVFLEYTAQHEGISQDRLLLLGKESGKAFDSLSIFAATKLVERLTVLNPIVQTAAIGETAQLRLVLNAGEDISFAEVSDIDVFIDYNADVLTPRLSSFVLGSRLLGTFRITDLSNNSNLGRIKFKIKSIAAAKVDDYGELVNFAFDVLLPAGEDNFSNIVANLNINNTSCVRFLQSFARVNLQPICVLDTRKIYSSGIDYQLEDISPNPALQTDPELNFSIGISGHVELTLFSSSGVEVLKAVDDDLEAGSYTVKIPASSLASGIYYYRLISGPFVETKKLVITK